MSEGKKTKQNLQPGSAEDGLHKKLIWALRTDII